MIWRQPSRCLSYIGREEIDILQTMHVTCKIVDDWFDLKFYQTKVKMVGNRQHLAINHCFLGSITSRWFFFDPRYLICGILACGVIDPDQKSPRQWKHKRVVSSTGPPEKSIMSMSYGFRFPRGFYLSDKVLSWGCVVKYSDPFQM